MHSIISNEKKCYICGSTQWLEVHHLYGGSNRKKSEKYGLTVYLCHHCHNEPPEGVHHNRDNMDWLRSIGQRRFNDVYPELNFRELFGKNYL